MTIIPGVELKLASTPNDMPQVKQTLLEMANDRHTTRDRCALMQVKQHVSAPQRVQLVCSTICHPLKAQFIVAEDRQRRDPALKNHQESGERRSGIET
jgi:hypothetical protein